MVVVAVVVQGGVGEGGWGDSPEVVEAMEAEVGDSRRVADEVKKVEDLDVGIRVGLVMAVVAVGVGDVDSGLFKEVNDVDVGMGVVAAGYVNVWTDVWTGRAEEAEKPDIGEAEVNVVGAVILK